MQVQTWLLELVPVLVETERTMGLRPQEVAPYFAEGVGYEIGLVSSTVPSEVRFVVSRFRSELWTWHVVVVVALD